jgi:hypothetical protein
MPRRTDIHTILIIGSGPIVIGQGCEFDYSGVQACRALREEGYRVVLINSNPATIMTDPEFADATYIEPITPEAVEKILVREAASGHPIDAILPTLGGQTGLNTGMACFDKGILTRHNVKPRCGVAIVTSAETRSAMPSSLIMKRASSPPMEWAKMTTRASFGSFIVLNCRSSVALSSRARRSMPPVGCTRDTISGCPRSVMASSMPTK